MRQKGKPGTLGRAFYEWLIHLETVEKLVMDQMAGVRVDKIMRKNPAYTINDKLFTSPMGQGPALRAMVHELMLVDASIASDVRSSVKYKVHSQTLTNLVLRYGAQTQYVLENYPLSLPYPLTTVIIEDLSMSDDVAVIFLDSTRKVEKDYTELGIKAGESYICANMCLWRKTGVDIVDNWDIGVSRDTPGVITSVEKADKQIIARMSHMPVEMHAKPGDTIMGTDWLISPAPGVDVTEIGRQVLRMVGLYMRVWLASNHVAGVLRQRQPGRLAGIKYPAPKKLTKLKDHPMYEHLVVELEIDEPDPQQTGGHKFQPKKRLHQVRSFVRHYQSGKMTVVKSHWRGNEKLGVLRKDFTMELHEEK